MAGFLLLLLALVASPVQADDAASVLLAERAYALDPSGQGSVADLARTPERFRPLPPFWQRAPPGVVRWERLSLRWPERPGPDAIDAVLHLRVGHSTQVTIAYPSMPAHCGVLPHRTVPDSATPITVARWLTVPLCPGATTVYLHFVTTHDAGPVVEVTSRLAAGVKDFSTSARAYILAAFVRSAGQQLETWQVFQLLGTPEGEAEKNRAMVAITRLRAKLVRTGAAEDCLRAIRQSGYRLCVPVRLA